MKIPIYSCGCKTGKEPVKIHNRSRCPECRKGSVVGYKLICPGYEGHSCGKTQMIKANQSAKQRCDECARQVVLINATKRVKKPRQAKPAETPSWWHPRKCLRCGKPTQFPDWGLCPDCKQYANDHTGQTGNDEVLSGHVYR